MSKPTVRKQDFPKFNIVECLKKTTLNLTDIVANSNKMYYCEVVKTDDGRYLLLTTYGRTGGTLTEEVRVCSSKHDAEIEAEKIIKSKIKKGYVEVKLVQATVGSELAKSKIEPSIISEDSAKKAGFSIQEEQKSSLHPIVQNLIRSWFGSIEQFVIDTLDTSKCALGQLSIDQINRGRDLLLEARKIVQSGKPDILELNAITSKYYSNIPMNFGYRRLDANVLRFDNNDKLDKAFDILDTLEGAKDVQKVLIKKNAIDDQYRTLNTEIEYIDPAEPIWNWINTLFQKTRAPNHHFLGKMKIHNIFRLKRNAEYESYMNMIDQMAKLNNSRIELPNLIKPIWNQRIKEVQQYETLYDRVNILPLFHGTRTPNFPKILSSRLMMRKPGFTVAGSMYDKNGGLYFGFSSKAVNYSSASGSYWSGGNDKNGYVFLSDVALGRQTIAKGSYPYTLEHIKPSFSVWAKGGSSGVINDEFIVYTEKQNWLRYIIEFETQAK